MEELFKTASSYIALCTEATAALVIFYGMIEALVGLAPVLIGPKPIGRRREVWVQFGVWLVLALEFELAADVIRTAIAPSWADLGQLAVIAAIRTVLNFFLEGDLERLRKRQETQAA